MPRKLKGYRISKTGRKYIMQAVLSASNYRDYGHSKTVDLKLECGHVETRYISPSISLTLFLLSQKQPTLIGCFTCGEKNE